MKCTSDHMVSHVLDVETFTLTEEVVLCITVLTGDRVSTRVGIVDADDGLILTKNGMSIVVPYVDEDDLTVIESNYVFQRRSIALGNFVFEVVAEREVSVNQLNDAVERFKSLSDRRANKMQSYIQNQADKIETLQKLRGEDGDSKLKDMIEDQRVQIQKLRLELEKAVNVGMEPSAKVMKVESSRHGFQVFVKSLTGKTIHVDCDNMERELVSTFKDKVSKATKTPGKHFDLVFADKPLQDLELTIGDYNVQHQSTVHMVIRVKAFGPEAGSFQKPQSSDNFEVFVKDLLGKNIQVVVTSTDTLDTFQKLVSKATKVPVERFRLIFAGQELKDFDMTIGDYDIMKESTVHMLGRLRGGVIGAGFSEWEEGCDFCMICGHVGLPLNSQMFCTQCENEGFNHEESVDSDIDIMETIWADSLTLFVMDWNGSKITAEVDRSDFLGDLRDFIEEYKEVWGEDFYFSHQGKPLDLTQTFEYYNIQNESMIWMNGRIRAGAVIKDKLKLKNKISTICHQEMDEDLTQAREFVRQVVESHGSAVLGWMGQDVLKVLRDYVSSCDQVGPQATMNKLLGSMSDEALNKIKDKIKVPHNNTGIRIDGISVASFAGVIGQLEQSKTEADTMIKAFKDAFRTPLQTHLDPTPNPPGPHSKPIDPTPK